MPDRGSPASERGRYFAADPCRCSAARRSRSGSAGSSLSRHSMPFVRETKMNGRGRPVCLPDRWRPPTVIGAGRSGPVGKGRLGAILLKNGKIIGYNCVIFANLDGWGAVDDGGAESPRGRVVLRVLARTTCAGKAPAASD